MADSAPQVYFFGSLAGHWTAFGLFASIAIGCGFAVTRIAGQFAAPRGQLHFYGTTPLARRLAGTALATALILMIWMWLWSGFHELTIASSDAVTLQYYVPPRHRVLARNDVLGAAWESGPRFSRYFVIRTRDGGRFSSMQTSMSDDAAGSVAASIRSRLGLKGS